VATSSFAALLRQHRQALGLTQEELAERAGLSARAISDLERGLKQAPRPSTVRLLAAGLELGSADAAELLAAARSAGAAGQPDALPRSSNLPAEVSTFIGRSREVAELPTQLRAARLVTLTGPGGVGKTRLALRVAAESVTSFPHGVWLVELAAVAEATLVPKAVTSTLDIREQPGQSLVNTLADALYRRELLLVLDNCEHLIQACAELAETLLRACPRLHILATSRQALRIPGERVWHVPPLQVPAPRAEQVATAEAVALFVARASAVQPSFALTDQTTATVAHVCRQLDGIPLAIELAAARLAVLSPEQLAARLDDRFQLLTAGSRTALPRQQTLLGTLDWSYDLLCEPERSLFRQLAVFAGGWTLEAAEAVGADAGTAPDEVLELLGRLVDQSLVIAELQPDGAMRYRLLETVRQYAARRLAEAGDAGRVHGRHATFFLGLVETETPPGWGPALRAWADRISAELGNIRAALAWACATPAAVELALRLGAALWPFWVVCGHLREGSQWLERALALPAGAGTLAARARTLDAAGYLAQYMDDRPALARCSEESLALAQALGDRRVLAGSLLRLGRLALMQGDSRRAAALLDESVGIWRELGRTVGEPLALHNLGLAARDQGRYAEAERYYEQSLLLFRELGDTAGAAGGLHDLADLALLRGESARAAALLSESLALRRQLDEPRGVALGLVGLGLVAWFQGDHGAAVARARESLVAFRDLGIRGAASQALELCAWWVTAHGELERAARLLGAAEGLWAGDAASTGPAPHLQSEHQRAVTALRAGLDATTVAQAWAAGRALPLEEAVACALSATEERQA